MIILLGDERAPARPRLPARAAKIVAGTGLDTSCCRLATGWLSLFFLLSGCVCAPVGLIAGLIADCSHDAEAGWASVCATYSVE